MTFSDALTGWIVCLVLALGGAGCSGFRTLDALVPHGGYVRTTDIAYGPLTRQKLDVYVPDDLRKPAGVVVFFYGGDWRNGEKGDYRFVAQALTSKGFVAVIADYRLYPEAAFPAFVKDGALAVRWAHDHAADFGGDPARLYLMGHSAGAHLAALLALDAHYLADAGLPPDAVRAAVAIAGPYDFKPRPVDLAVFDASGPELVLPAVTQPIHFARADAPPMLLITGTADRTVDPANATRLAAALTQAGGSATVIRHPYVGHVGAVLSLAWPFRWRASVLSETAAFFRGHL